MFSVYYVIHEAMQNTIFKKREEREEREERGELEKIIINTPSKINDSP
jgi:hypothetical protein